LTCTLFQKGIKKGVLLGYTVALEQEDFTPDRDVIVSRSTLLRVSLLRINEGIKHVGRSKTLLLFLFVTFLIAIVTLTLSFALSLPDISMGNMHS
jgi:hypothetical protein